MPSGAVQLPMTPYVVVDELASSIRVQIEKREWEAFLSIDG
jgi:hypothetical protein